MSAGDNERRELEEALHVDEIGIRPVPPEGRDATALQQFWIWAGANLAPISWIVGTVGIALGLSLLETILIAVIGQAVGALIFGLFALMGHRTGVNQMVLARVTFGRRGAYLPALLQTLMATGWIGINTYVVLDLCLGIAHQMGLQPGDTVKYGLAVAIMIVQVVIGVLGFYAIRTFEKYTVPVVTVVMVVMTVVVLTRLGDISWTESSLAGGERFTAATQLLTAVGVGWGMGWITWASDYSRFTRPGVSPRRLYAASAMGIFAPLSWLSILGALSGTASQAGDPAEIVASLFGIMTVPVLFVILHGPVGTNIVNIYTASLGLLSLDMKLKRTTASLLTGVIGFLPLFVFIESESFAAGFTNFMSSVVIWLSPWAGVTLVDWYVVRRRQVECDALYADPRTSRYGDVNMRAVSAFLAGLASAWAFQYGAIEAFQGPVARAMGNVDLSWAAGMGVSAVLYFLLTRGRAGVAAAPPAPRVESAGENVVSS
ncbi:purine-cytosine permease family protein [Streptosporangium roseum]|uniref:purine-cytosine permease family protein n=1 Tax=Streptosporangium roseum TaxID=2001 RepID=UPI0004CCF73E|nr:cytosine permease [Streptosporangium roseum]